MAFGILVKLLGAIDHYAMHKITTRKLAVLFYFALLCGTAPAGGVVTGRLGYAFDRLLVYAKGGAAFVQKHYDFTDTCTVGACAPLTLSMSRDKINITWAAGGGLEYAFYGNWSIKAEYLYLATGETFTFTGTASDGNTYAITHTDPAVHTVKVGLNFRAVNWQ